MHSGQWQIQFPVIDKLADEFTSLVREIRRVIRALGPDRLRELKECVEDKLKSKTMKVALPSCVDDLISAVDQYWDYLNFEIAQLIVKYLSDDKLVKEMNSYEQMVRQNVKKVLQKCKKKSIKVAKKPPDCVTMSVTLDVDPVCYSLYQIIEAKDFLVDKLGLAMAKFVGFTCGSIILFFCILKNDAQAVSLKVLDYLEDLREMKMVNVEVESYFSFDVVTGKASLHDCWFGKW